ncbi:hypothetical protein Goarm_015881, partial [Gossypium armourianum]|nr:hypothetical protein [Gossypium armourianum]
MGRIAQGTKVLAEGGYEKIFRHTFVTDPEEQLGNSFVCYLSTSAGPVMGILYVSTAKLAYCSDTPLPYKNGTQTEWSYYKVVIPLHQLKAVNPSTSRLNCAEKKLCNSIADITISRDTPSHDVIVQWVYSAARDRASDNTCSPPLKALVAV